MKRIVQLWGTVMLLALWMVSATAAPSHAWTWDDDEAESQDEIAIQMAGYRKRVEGGIALQERVVLLDRLIKLHQIHKRDSKALEEERAQLVADENAIQTVSILSRQKSQELFQKGFELVRTGHYKQALDFMRESEHLNPTDKSVGELSTKLEQVVAIMAESPSDPNTGDLIRRGVVQFMQNENSRALNFILYAQQKSPAEPAISDLVELVKRSAPSGEILDARLNLIDQKLQRALEKIYAGEYLVAAKECQEVLDLEPENPLALTRLGSVYYAMGQVKQARSFWEQALAVDPNNDVLKSFLSQTLAEADKAPAQALTYRVEKGDTLQKIAENVYKDASLWRKLYEANKSYLKNAYTLTAGQVLVVPPAGGSR